MANFGKDASTEELRSYARLWLGLLEESYREILEKEIINVFSVEKVLE